MRRHFLSAAALIVALAGGSARGQVPVDFGWTYQGRLTNNGSPANGNYDLRFTLYSDVAGTVQVGPQQTMAGTVVTEGLFTVRVNFGSQFTGSKRWLKVEVSPPGAGTYTALPLTEISSAPQSLLSQVLVFPYAGNGNVASPGAMFRITNAGTGEGIWGQADGPSGSGVYGYASSATGFNFGGHFFTNSPDGRAIRAVNNATTGLAVAGRFGTGSPDGIGVWSTASAVSGVNYGVYGDTFSTSGYGVYGRASATTGGNYGVYGESASVSGSGVYGVASSSTGFNFGGHFFTNSPDGRAVRAVNNALSGQAVAGRFGTGSPSGLSIWTTASASSGVNYGIYADTNSASGFGGYFRNSAGGAALWADGLCRVKTLQILGGADLAEPFDVAAASAGAVAEPGMVVVIDAANPGNLRMADQPYDSKVAGVISGANGLEPGMVMSAKGHEKSDGKHPVAMTGRVWVYVDASFGAIEPGSLLTSSSTPGHAMLAADRGRAFGTVIGKAMTELKDGKGLVLVLVNLQ